MKKILLFFAALAVAFSAMAETMTIDFESATTEYTDWTFSNITTLATHTNVSAHGGSYFGTTNGKGTAYVCTKTTIADPTSIKFYISKQSSNTTTSNWKVFVKTASQTWSNATEVTTVSATSMAAGTWVEVSADLSSYSDVQVEVYYTGSTAVRTIDDLTLTYGTGGSSEPTVTVTAPTFSVEAGSFTESQNITVSNYDDDLMYFYTTDGTTPACDANLDATGTTLVYDNNAGITISSTCTLKMIAVDEDVNVSSVTSVAYQINVFNSLADLVAANLTSGTTVKVTFSNVSIKSFYTSGSYTNGVYFDIQKDSKDIEIYYRNVPSEWVAGGKLSGTMTCPWVKYSGTWELAPAQDTWSWDNLTYTAPAGITAPTNTWSATSFDAYLGAENVFPTLNDGEDPTDGTITYSSSNTNAATIDASGVITLKAEGTTTIKATASETSEHSALVVSYVLYVKKQNLPVELPFTFDGGKADVNTTTGMSHSGLGADYNSSPKLKFDSKDDELVIYYNEAAAVIQYTIKGNSFSESTFSVMESEDGETYTTLKSYTELGDAMVETVIPNTASRYVKFVFTSKKNGNVALGAITISNELEYEYTLYGSIALFGGEEEDALLDENKMAVTTDEKVYRLTKTVSLVAEQIYYYNVKETPVIPAISAASMPMRVVAATDDKSFVADKTGTYTIQFDYNTETKQLTASDPATGWATGIQNADATKVEKIFRNGQVVIIKNGVEYNALGQKL